MTPREAGQKAANAFIDGEIEAGRPLHGDEYEKRREAAKHASWDVYKASGDYAAYRATAPIARLQHWWRELFR